MFSYEFCKIFQNTFFTEHHRMTASEFNKSRTRLIGQIVIGSFFELKRNPSFFFTSSYKSYTFTQKNENESYAVLLIVCSRPPCELCALTIRINTPKNIAKKI